VAEDGAERVAIALGSNQGDRLENLRRALEAIERSGLLRDVRASHAWETPPEREGDGGAFLNAAVSGDTRLQPRALLEALLAIEGRLGRSRVPGAHGGPRTIDLDLLLFGQWVVAESRAGLDLVVPHPRLAERPFVLIPLCDLDPALLHPVLGKTVAQLLAAVSPQTSSSSVAPGVRRYDPGGRPTRPDWQDPLFHQQN